MSYLFENILLDFPTHRQDNTCSCGSSVVQSILTYYGIDKRQDDLSKSLHMTKDGISYTEIIDKLKYYKLQTESGIMSQENVKKFIDNQIPVIILIQAYSADKKYSKDKYTDGHFVIIIGYDDSKFFIEDPSINNNIGYIPFKELDIRWHGYGQNHNEKLDHYGIAVIGKPKFFSNKLKKVE